METPSDQELAHLWHLWLRQKHLGQLVEDRAWLHLDHPTELVSSLVRTVDWHEAPGVWGLLIVPIAGTTAIDYPAHTLYVDQPTLLHTNTLHRWRPVTQNVFWARKLTHRPRC